MNVSPYISALTAVCVITGLFILAIMLYTGLKLRVNFKLFIIGIFIYLMTDLVRTIINEIAKSSSSFAEFYDSNLIYVTTGIYFIQGFVFAVCAYFGVKFILAGQRFTFERGFTAAAGMASMCAYISCMRPMLSNILVLSAYRSHLRSPQEILSEQEIESMMRLTAEITNNQVYKIWLSLGETFLLMFVMMAIGYLAARHSENENMTGRLSAAGIFIIYQTSIAFLNSFVSMWAGLTAGALAGAAALYFLYTQINREPV